MAKEGTKVIGRNRRGDPRPFPQHIIYDYATVLSLPKSPQLYYLKLYDTDKKCVPVCLHRSNYAKLRQLIFRISIKMVNKTTDVNMPTVAGAPATTRSQPPQSGTVIHLFGQGCFRHHSPVLKITWGIL